LNKLNQRFQQIKTIEKSKLHTNFFLKASTYIFKVWESILLYLNKQHRI
jgi:hypothetical protein